MMIYAYTEDWCVRFHLMTGSSLAGQSRMTKIKSCAASYFTGKKKRSFCDSQDAHDNKQHRQKTKHRTVVLPKYIFNSQTAEVSFWQHSVWTGIQVSFTYAVWGQVNVKAEPVNESTITNPLQFSTQAQQMRSKIQLVLIHSHFSWLKSTGKRRLHTWENIINHELIDSLNSYAFWSFSMGKCPCLVLKSFGTIHNFFFF